MGDQWHESLNSATAEAFHARFRRVLEYIDAHLDEELSVDQLSAVGCGLGLFQLSAAGRFDAGEPSDFVFEIAR